MTKKGNRVYMLTTQTAVAWTTNEIATQEKKLRRNVMKRNLN